MNHLEIHQILCRNQLGFRTKYSCESQLLLNIRDFTHYMNNKNSGYTFKACAKAEILWNKTKPATFGSNRFHQTDHRKLQWKVHILLCAIISDILQSSVLGPTLLLIYINGLVTHTQGIVQLFADDCLIYCMVSMLAKHQMWPGLRKSTMWAQITPCYIFANIFPSKCAIQFL